MSTSPRVPEELRRRVNADLRPVAPLPSPERRALHVAFWIALALAAVPIIFGVRHDASAIGLVPIWGAALAQCAIGLWLVDLSLREGVPGRGVAGGRTVAAIAAAAAVEIAVVVITWLRDSHAGAAGGAGHSGAMCFGMESALALPALGITAWLVVRAFPLRPARAGLFAGTGAGLATDGIWHLVCPVSSLEHVLRWHVSSVVVLALIGSTAGWLWSRRS